MKKLILLPMLALLFAGCASDDDYGAAPVDMAEPEVILTPADPADPAFDPDPTLTDPAAPGSLDDDNLDGDRLEDDDDNRIDNTPSSPGDSGTQPLP